MILKHIIKITIDIIFSLVLLVIITPIMVAVAFIIYISDGFPVIFKQFRVGKNGNLFELYKFRTLKKNMDLFGESPQSRNDPNIIKGGSILRAYSLDELPQLFNILKGEMSVVGPRPLFQKNIQELSKFHKQRLLVRPGLTGLSQINMRSNLLSQKSLDMEVKYVKNYSILLDLLIMVKTIKVIVKKEGVFH